MVAVAVEVEKRVGALPKSKARQACGSHQVNPVHRVDYERVAD